MAQQQAPAQATSNRAQNSVESREAFEVASVRPSNPAGGGGAFGGGRGGSIGGCGDGIPRITPNRFAATNVTVYTLSTWAYGLGECVNVSSFALLSGGPAWVRSDAFNIQAVMPEGTPSYTFEQLRRGDAPKLALMLQALLADRFKLALHTETREIPVYALTVAKGGPKLHQVEEGGCTPSPPIDVTQPSPRPPAPGEKPWCGSGGIGINPSRKATADLRAMSLDEFSSMLGPLLDRPVTNKTGISGMVAFHLEFAFDPGASRFASMLPPRSDRDTVGVQGAVPADPSGPSIFTAIQEQVGLKLEPTKGPIRAFVIDRVERPSEN